MTSIDALQPALLRRVCGQWATGVAVVLGSAGDGRLLGMAVNSFSSVSLDPPLILFCPALSSTTWPEIRATGRFAVEFLAADQDDLARRFAGSGENRFAGVALRRTDDGLPAIAGAVARLVSEIHAVHPAGDHEIVVGRVRSAEYADDARPLLFHRGRMGAYPHP